MWSVCVTDLSVHKLTGVSRECIHEGRKVSIVSQGSTEHGCQVFRLSNDHFQLNF